MTTFFSVDVETTSTNPFEGELLTVGVVAVSPTGDILDDLYVRIDPLNGLCWDSDTFAWWQEQDIGVRMEAYEDDDLLRLYPHQAARLVREFVHKHGCVEDGSNENVFVANPVSFDYSWLVRLFTQSSVPNPFGYRTLCLRSAAWNGSGQTWQLSSRANKSNCPHHALADARAQALDLIDILSVGALDILCEVAA